MKMKFKLINFVISMIMIASLVASLTMIAFGASQTQDFVIGQSYNGFKLLCKKSVSNADTVARVFVHNKSGAKVIHLANADKNKVFGIGFKTPPSDSTGAPHIVEHSTLNGSEKFPVKSLFNEMLKRSTSTFMNALTSDDCTIYPVASLNSKDFRNLIDVYMDAVFHPNFLKQPEIFMQEGWSYSLHDKKEDITCSGVVYNEMKGLYSNPLNRMSMEISKSLYPNTAYYYDAGGDPAKIPNLTYENFVKFYKRYYHPSNSCIYLYGDLDLLDTLKFLDQQYLCKYNRKNIKSTVPLQKHFRKRRYSTAEYGIPANATVNGKTYISINFSLDPIKDYETLIGLSTLANILTGTDASLLKQEMLKEELGNNISCDFDYYKRQPVFSCILEGANESDASIFESKVEEALRKFVEKGIDMNLIASVINATELNKKTVQSNPHKGLLHMFPIMLNWVHGTDPLLYVSTTSEDNVLKKMDKPGYFENLISKYLLHNNHSSCVILKPIPGLVEQKQSEDIQKLRQYKESLSSSEIQQLIDQTKALEKWKNTPNSKEALATLPSISVEDLETNEEDIPTDIQDINGVKLLFHPLGTDSIAHVNMYFDTTKVPQQQLCYLSLLGILLGRMDTKKYDYEELNKYILANCGGIYYCALAKDDSKEHKKYYPKFMVSTEAFIDKLPDTLDIVNEINYNSKFDDIKRLKEIVSELQSSCENPDSFSFAVQQVNSQISDKYAYINEIFGRPFLKFIKGINQKLSDDPQTVVKNLCDVYRLVFSRENLIIGVTTEHKNIPVVKEAIKNIIDMSKVVHGPSHTYTFRQSKNRVGLLSTESIQNAVLGANIENLGYKYNGKMQVLSAIISNYLHKNVREQGGAYGATFEIFPDGIALFSSFRDPNMKKTLETFKETANVLRTFNANDAEMFNYISRAISYYFKPLDISLKGCIGDDMYITNTTKEDIKKTKDEILSTTAQDIRNFAKMIQDICEQNVYCISGNKANIEQYKDLFDELKDVS